MPNYCPNCNCEHCVQQNQRTPKQNNSLHLYFALLAQSLNDSGHDMRSTIRQDIDIPWTPETVKQYLWKPIQQAYFRKSSTAQLKKNEIDKVYEVLNKTIGERTGVSIEFPSLDNFIDK